MPLPTPSSSAGRRLPFKPRQRVARHPAWPFQVACEPPAAPQIRTQAARVIATTARHWLGRV